MTSVLRGVLGLLLLLGWGGPARGQAENSNWFFGAGAAVSFPAGGGPATALGGSALSSQEACASVSDSTGRLLFYSNSETVWSRNHQVMAGGTSLGGHQSATQGVVAVRRPGSARQYYLLVLDATENALAGGLKYNLLDLGANGGLGEVMARRVQLSAPGQLLTEKLAAVPHANGRDSWVLVHGWQSNTFYAYLLTPGGVSATPVASSVGAVHSAGGPGLITGSPIGCMQPSPDGTRLAVAINGPLYGLGLELFDFNQATGKVSAARSIGLASYGVAFSPNGQLLYCTTSGNALWQLDLRAGSEQNIFSSRQLVAQLTRLPGSIQPGPDGRLYVAVPGSQYLAVINQPDVRGAGCHFQPNGVYLNGAACQYGLPNYPARQLTPATALPDFRIEATCLGEAALFNCPATLPGAVATWNFGEPATGAANVATGLTATHTYAQPGPHPVQLTLTHPLLTTPATATLTFIGQHCPAFLPNVITPDGDLRNDSFVLNGLTAADWQLTVFNRWGRPVYAQAHYDNGWRADGQPAGSYYYLLRHHATSQLLRGWVEVHRAD